MAGEAASSNAELTASQVFFIIVIFCYAHHRVFGRSPIASTPFFFFLVLCLLTSFYFIALISSEATGKVLTKKPSQAVQKKVPCLSQVSFHPASSVPSSVRFYNNCSILPTSSRRSFDSYKRWPIDIGLLFLEQGSQAGRRNSINPAQSNPPQIALDLVLRYTVTRF